MSDDSLSTMSDDGTVNPPPMQPPIILFMETSNDGSSESLYRFVIGGQIKEITISPGTFDSETLKSPIQFLPRLPDSERWTFAHISRDKTSGDLNTFISSRERPPIRNQWHHTLVDYHDLETGEWLYERTFEVVSHSGILPGGNMVAKIARSESEMPLNKRETRAYQLLKDSRLTLRFLGHIHKNGRIIGFLIEKLEGRCASSDDLAICKAALERVHGLGLLHGNVNRYNFLITDQGVKLLNFELSEEITCSRSMYDEVTRFYAEFDVE
ncbi:alpha-galactosidase a [Fusarium sporotrichioides]|uniref:Alpha-galactosidase a n=1 Tax=Fusarium sporotrichioides TaxID=5514 RepID=A0A395STE2_FUSSP|nr:alpha-galactosidase a [Fusarium sporotrichioides]